MANLIDRTYFVIDTFIPQLGQLAVQEKVDAYIARYEPRFLADLLGVKFYQDLLAGLAAPAPEQRWLDLVQGKTYDDTHGNTYVWTGLANPVSKVSPIANFVYYWYTRSDASFSVGTGEVLPKTQNGVRNTFVDKQVQAWGEMVKMCYDCLHYLETNKALYPEWQGLPGWASSDWVFFLTWWGRWYWQPVPVYSWWPACPQPDIFKPLNSFGI